MTGGGQHVDVVAAAAQVGSAIHRREEVLEDAAHHLVGSVVVIAPFGCLVDQQLAQGFVPREILGNRGEQIGQLDASFAKDELLDGGQAIGQGADADALQVARVVAGAARIVVPTALDAVVGDQ